MDWTRAIECNHAALARIVAALFAMVGLVPGGVMEKPPNAVRLAVLRILRPAESAVRRLIMIAAHGLQVKLPPPRPGPSGPKISGKGAGSPRAPRIPAFKLYDSRKRFVGLNGFGPKRRKGPRQRITFIDTFDPRIPAFLRAPPPAPAPDVPEARSEKRGSALARRLAAIDAALRDIPKQAVRMAHWQERRALKVEAKFRDPLRIGKPPGYRKKPDHEVDDVLKECHSLARDLPSPPTPPPPNTS